MTATYRDPMEWEEAELVPRGIRPSSAAWRVVIRALYGTRLDATELELYRTLSGGVDPTPGGALELLAVVGRRGGKSEEIARVGVFECCHVPHGIALAPGQLGLLAVISPLREQSQEIMGYARGLCGVPSVRRYLEGEPGRDRIQFKTGVALGVMTADALNVSGPTLVGVIRDEWAKWPGDDSVMPDREIENSLRPALAPVRGAPPRRLLGITSAYIREGLAFETDRDCFGTAGADVMVVRGESTTFNPNLDPAFLDRERRRNKRAFEREYLVVWQDAILDGYFAEVLDGCVDTGRTVNEPVPGVSYVVAIDPAFKGDRFALAVVHRERSATGRLLTVVDLVKAWTPPRGGVLSTDAMLIEVEAIARQYGADFAYTDQASAPALIEAAQRIGFWLIEVPWTGGFGENSKSAKFRRVHAAMADALVRLPDDPPTLQEFSNVSSRLLRSGGEQIEARAGHDDRVAAVVLAVVKAMENDQDFGVPVVVSPPKPGTAEWIEQREEERLDRMLERNRERELEEEGDWLYGGVS